jgi:uncharacterized protein (DUF302 family)
MTVCRGRQAASLGSGYGGGGPHEATEAADQHKWAAAEETAMADRSEKEITTKVSPRSVAETVSRLTGIVSAKGLKLFALIDHSAEASHVGLKLRETTVVVFGNPPAGTPVMVAAPLAALDLPLKVLVWTDNGQTKVSYYGPAAFAARYGLSADLAAKLAGIDQVTDALIAP